MTRNLTVAAAALLLSACTLPNLDDQTALATTAEMTLEEESSWVAVYAELDGQPQPYSPIEAFVGDQLVTVDDGELAVGAEHAITMRLAAFGREQIFPVEHVSAQLLDGRVLFDRGELQEWYEVSDSGVEIGFDLKSRPDGALKTPLQLRMMLGGSQASHVGNAAHLRAGNQAREIEVGFVEAWDGQGLRLPVYLVPFDRGYDLFVDDSEAEYPIQVVPFVDVMPTLSAAN
jgi:hypothetical protein